MANKAPTAAGKRARKSMSEETAVVIAAAGSGSRFGDDLPKQYRVVAGRPLIAHTLQRFINHAGVGRVVVSINPEHESMFTAATKGLNVDAIVPGGCDRQQSVRSALEHLSASPPGRVLIHDGARPLPSSALIDRTNAALDGCVAAAPVLPISDTLVRGIDGASGDAVKREGLFRVQTPQAFHFGVILDAHRRFADQSFTDDASLAREAGHAVRLVAGEENNVKVTRQEDIDAVMRLLTPVMESRTGSGFDVHKLGPGKKSRNKLRIGGVDIPFAQSLIGHSDADVALHAITDALLGALGAGDIGQHFPPSDAQWRDMDSSHFLAEAGRLADEKRAMISLIDLTIICQKPKIGPHRDKMVARIAEILGISPSRVNVKATTTEGLGFTGRAEGIAAMASASILIPS